MKSNYLIIAASLMLLSFGLNAQPGPGERPSRPQKKTPEEIARKQADMMKAELNITDKQYKKVYKLIKKDHTYRQNQAENVFGGGMPSFGGPGMGGPGMGGGMMGGPGMGGGMMGGPGMGGGMMGGPGMGGDRPSPGEMGSGQRPENRPGMGPGSDVVSDEYLEKQEKKLKKILTDEQYRVWRSKHPAEHLELPPMKFGEGSEREFVPHAN